MTEWLRPRLSPPPDLEAENAALHAIARELVKDSQATLDALIAAALTLCRAGSAGVSLLETLGDGTRVFRWVAMAGEYALHLGGSTPADFSPCGTTLARGAPQLFSYPERFFTYFQQSRPVIVEGLVVPLRVGEVVGTIWVVSHDENTKFTGEDVRVMTSLADFTSAALALQPALKRPERNARRQGEAIDAATFGGLYDRYAPTVMALALRIVKNQKDAEEVALDAFEEMWRRGRQEDHPSCPATDLTTGLLMLTRNRAVGLLRRRGIRRMPEYDDREWSRGAPGGGEHSTGSAPHDVLAPAVRSALAALSLENRRAVVLSVFDGFTAAEIGRALGEPAEAIDKQIRTGLVHFGRLIGHGRERPATWHVRE